MNTYINTKLIYTSVFEDQFSLTIHRGRWGFVLSPQPHVVGLWQLVAQHGAKVGRTEAVLSLSTCWNVIWHVSYVIQHVIVT